MSLRVCHAIITTLLALLCFTSVLAQDGAEAAPSEPAPEEGAETTPAEGEGAADAAADSGEASATTEGETPPPEGEGSEALPAVAPGGFDSGDTVVDGQEETEENVLSEEPELPMPEIEPGALSPYGDLMSVPPAETTYSDLEIAGLVVMATGTATTIVGGLLWANDLDTAGSATLGTGAGIALVGAGLLFYELRAADFEQAYSDDGMSGEPVEEAMDADNASDEAEGLMPLDAAETTSEDAAPESDAVPEEGDTTPPASDSPTESDVPPEETPAEPVGVEGGSSALPKLAPGVTWLPEGGVMFGLQGRF